MDRLRALMTNALPPLLFFILILGAWHFAVVLFDIKPFLLPSPLQVAAAVAEHGSRLVSATLLTGWSFLTGRSSRSCWSGGSLGSCGQACKFSLESCDTLF